VGLSRRGFVLGALATPVVAALPNRARTAWAEGEPWRFFDAHQAAVVEAATARLIPGPTDDLLELDHAGARECNVVGFIDAFLGAFTADPPTIYAGGPFSNRGGASTNDMAEFVPLSPIQEKYWRQAVTDLQATYRQGVQSLDAAAGGDFTKAIGLQQDLILTADGSGFRDVLFDHAIQGWLSAPEYGGNADQKGWTQIDFPGDTSPRGFTAQEVSTGDGLDIIDPIGLLDDLVDRLEDLLGA
jgi:hypothetical protein